MKRSVLLSALSLMFCSLPALAQTAPAAASTSRPDIEFGATVHMDSIRFNGPPRASVTFSGGPQLESRHEVGRGGLPVPIPIGRTYRNVTVDTTIGATLLDPSIDATVQTQVGTPASPTPPNTKDSP